MAEYPNKDFVIKDVSIPDCKAPPCHFKRGDTAEIKFTLVQGKNYLSLLMRKMYNFYIIIIIILKIKGNYPLPSFPPLPPVAGGTYDKVYIAMCGEISILCANLALTKSSVCDLGADCPLKKGSSNDITVKVPISSSYPKVRINYYSSGTFFFYKSNLLLCPL